MINTITQLDNGKPIDDLAEHEVDAHIADCGQLIQKAIADGDRPAAIKWQDAMYEAIRSRTPAHKARLEAEAWARVENPQNCYFMASGDLARVQREGTAHA